MTGSKDGARTVQKSKNGPNHPKKDTQLLPLPKRLFQAHQGPRSHTSGFGVLWGSPPPELSNNHCKPVDTNFSASSTPVAAQPAPRDGAVSLGRQPLPAPLEKALTANTRLPQQSCLLREKPRQEKRQGKAGPRLAPQLQLGRDFSCPPLVLSHLRWHFAASPSKLNSHPCFQGNICPAAAVSAGLLALTDFAVKHSPQKQVIWEQKM